MPRTERAKPKSEPVLRFAGATMAFRLEAVVGDRPAFEPESIIGQWVELDSVFGFFKGRVRSVDPYIDPSLGPGHWVVLDNRAAPVETRRGLCEHRDHAWMGAHAPTKVCKFWRPAS